VYLLSEAPQHLPEDIGHYQRLEDVQFEMSVRPSHSDRDVVPHHLRAYHGQRLTLRRVHFAC